MSSPTQRELALETLLRERDAQVTELVVSIRAWYNFLSNFSR